MLISATTISLAFVATAHFYTCKTKYTAFRIVLWTRVEYTDRRLLETNVVVFSFGRLTFQFIAEP